MLSTIPSRITGIFVIGLLCVGLSFTGWAQSNFTVGGTRLPFNPFNDSLATDAVPLNFPLGPGGSAVVNDPVGGAPLFYADGAGIYSPDGTVLQALGGDRTANQPVAVVPRPDDNATDGIREYYVFVNEKGTIVRYTVSVNVQEAPIATVTTGPTATGITGAANAMTIVPNEDNSNYWLVTQQAGTPDFVIYDVAAGTTVPAGQGAPQAFTAANISFSKASGQLAVADAANGQGVRLLTIDPATGQLTYTDDFNIPNTEAAYDTEWSRDGSKLYVSTGAGGNVYQYDTATGTATPVSQAPGVANYGLQRGPDGSVYHVYETAGGEFQLGRINSADSAASLLSVDFGLLGGADLGGQQFSATPASDINLSGVTLQPSNTGGCTNNPVQLLPNILLNGAIPQPENGIPDPDSIVWLIDGQRYAAFSPTIIPEQAPAVQVTAYWGDDSVSAGPYGLRLKDFQLQVPIVQDTTICPDEVLELCAAPQDGGGQGGGGLPIPGAGGGSGNCEAGSYTYLWSTGSTEPNIEVDEAGIYWVLVTDPSTGCTAYAESNVKEYQVSNQTYNEWYFGTGGGINFNTLYDNPDNPDDNGDGAENDGQITPKGNGEQQAPAGVEAVSDPNGDILFYTDGSTVWFVGRDPNTGEEVHTVMPIGDSETSIGGSPEATQVVSIPVPGTDALYYIFTTTAVEDGGYELNYSIVDLRGSQSSPGPSVVSSNNTLFVKSTERIAIQGGGNGGPATLVAHEYGTNRFRAYPITEQGIGNQVISSVGSEHEIGNENDARGQMKFGGDSTGAIIAVAVDGAVEVFNFDTETLEVSEPVTIDFAGRGQPYGVEIASDSSGNTVLYVSTDTGIYGATINRPVTEGQNIPVVPVSGANSRPYGAIQQGPDGQIYVAQPGQNNIGSLNPNPNDPANSNYNAAALPDGLPNGAVSGYGLPTYVAQGGNSFPEPSISVEDACVGNETTFSATGRDDSIEEYKWQIVRVNDDGTELNYALPDSLRTEQTFTFAIDTTGNFIARVTLTNKCDEDTVLTQEFIMNTATEVILPESVNLCNGDVALTAIDPAEDDGSFTFAWVRRGAEGGGNFPDQNTISVSEEGLYSVTVTNAEGCVSEGEIIVVDNRPDVELPEDFTLCQRDERELDVKIPSPGNPGYEWNVLNEAGASVFTSNEPVLEVSETTPDAGVYTYTVTVTDDAPEGCFVRDTVIVTVQPAPVFESLVTLSECGQATGTIDVNITSDPADTYTYTITDDGGNLAGSGSGLTFSQGGLAAGVYRVTATNAVGCSTTESVGIDDQDVDYSATTQPVPGCEDDGYFVVSLISEAASIVGAGVNYTLRSDDGTLVASGTTGPVMPAVGSSVDVNIPAAPGLAPGLYDFEFVGDNGQGCVFTLANQELIAPDSVDFSFEQDPVQGCGVTATIAVNYNPTGGDNWTFRWFREDGSAITAPQGQSTLAVNQSGTYSVEVTDNAGGLCASTQEIDVYLNEPFDINIETIDPDNSCETGERQLRVDFIPEAAETRDLIYTWTLNGSPLPNATRTITATAPGDYGVRVRARNSACFATDLEPVNVNQPLSVNLFYRNACADGSDVALFAEVRTEGTDSLEFAWFNPAGERIPAGSERGDTLVIRPDYPEGDYRVEVTSLVNGAAGCSAEAVAGFFRNPVPVTNLTGGPFIICPQDPDPEVNSVLLQVGAAPEIYWTTPKGEFVNTIDVLADQGGIYQVEVVNEFGCSVIDSVEVIEDCSPRITAPNAFRPGGVNDAFFVYPKYVSTDDFEVKIYNRWGELVFQSTDRDFRWDGTYNGKVAPLGTYPYVIHYKADTQETSDNILEERGGVTVIR